MLRGGGSVVTRVAPAMDDFSIVIEKMDSANSVCARGSNPKSEVRAEEVVLQLRGAFLALVTTGGKALALWSSNFSSANDEGINPDEAALFVKRATRLPVAEDGTVRLSVAPETVHTLTTLTTGGKGSGKPSPPSAPFPVPYRQPFDDEAEWAPPRFWYDQMGAWEVQTWPGQWPAQPAGGEVTPNTAPNKVPNMAPNKVMRQVVPQWPECWGYSCTGPTTYLGPGDFHEDLAVSFALQLEARAALTLQGDAAFHLVLNASSGQWALDDAHGGGLSLALHQWHQVTLALGASWVAATVDGTLLANVTSRRQRQRVRAAQAAQGQCDNATFPVDLGGKQYMNLDPGPSEAGSAAQCQQACCELGDACQIWQFSEHPSRPPHCWLGQSSAFQPDPKGVYVSRGRSLPGWKLMLQLDRYVFAAIDDFAIERL